MSESHMTRAHFSALMLCRRMMGDVGAEARLRKPDFEKLLDEVARSLESETLPVEGRANSEFSVNTCNGPTRVTCAGISPRRHPVSIRRRSDQGLPADEQFEISVGGKVVATCDGSVGAIHLLVGHGE